MNAKLRLFLPMLPLLVMAASAPPAWAQQKTRTLTFLHINDVYEIWPKRGIGGLANLMTLLKRERKQAPGAITTLGGDLISPSLMSSVTKGAHMIRFMNRMGLTVAVLGNHEFDFGYPTLKKRIAESKFTWVGANVTDTKGKPLPNVPGTWLRTVEGIKVGILGLVTPESRVYIRGNTPVRFEDHIAAARDAIASLRKRGAQVIVALTHLNMREDVELARKIPEISLILGGHDHNALNAVIGRTLIIKVGSDAAWLGVVKLQVTLRKGRSPILVPSWRQVAVYRVQPDPKILRLAKSYESRLTKRLGKVIGKTKTAMTSESNFVRSRETAIGNLIADAARAAVNADVAIINGGGIRGNRRYAKGSKITAKHILAELPFNNSVVVLALSGRQLKAALEHGISGPRQGRFPQVSGLKLFYERIKPEGDRIVSIEIGGKPLEPSRRYRVATIDFLADGGDGYTMFQRAPRVVSAQNGPRITQAVIAYIRRKKVVAADVEGRIVGR